MRAKFYTATLIPSTRFLCSTIPFEHIIENWVPIHCLKHENRSTLTIERKEWQTLPQIFGTSSKSTRSHKLWRMGSTHWVHSSKTNMNREQCLICKHQPKSSCTRPLTKIVSKSWKVYLDLKHSMWFSKAYELVEHDLTRRFSSFVSTKKNLYDTLTHWRCCPTYYILSTLSNTSICLFNSWRPQWSRREMY